jgi:Methylamine utilisation protein MauE
VNAALGPYAIAAGLLALAGAMKALRPADTATALRGVGVRVPTSMVRAGGLAEVVVGSLALVIASVVVAVLVAISYVAFAVFVTVALVRHLPIASCGCLGKADSPPSVVHVGIDVAAALAALAIAVDPGLAPLDLLHQGVGDSVAYAVLVVIGIAAAGLAVTLLPRVLALVHQEVR